MSESVRPLKVLVVEGYLVPEQMAHWFAAAEQGVELHFACAPGSAGELTATTGIEFHLFRPVGWVKRGHLWWWYPGLADLVEELSPDVIHATAETYGVTFSQLDLDSYRVVGHVVDNLWMHGNFVERQIRIRRASRILKKLAGVASWNRAGLELARRFGLPPELPTTIVPGRIASPEPFSRARDERDSIRERLGFHGKPAVGFVGRLVPEKGVDWLFASWAASAARHDCRLVVIGQGPAESDLRSLAVDLSIDVDFVGSVATSEVPEVMAALDLLVVPSLTAPAWAEQFGRVIVEAMFAGTPVIASDSGSIPEVVGEGGVIVPESDRSALSAAIDDLMLDRERRTEVGESGRRWALSQFSPQKLGADLVRFWREVAEG